MKNLVILNIWILDHPIWATGLVIFTVVLAGIFFYFVNQEMNFLDKNKKSKLSFHDFLNEDSNLSLKDRTVKHLQGVSNQKIFVPVTDHGQILITDLIEEVRKESPMGIKFMDEWLKTIELVKKITGEK